MQAYSGKWHFSQCGMLASLISYPLLDYIFILLLIREKKEEIGDVGAPVQLSGGNLVRLCNYHSSSRVTVGFLRWCRDTRMTPAFSRRAIAHRW